MCNNDNINNDNEVIMIMNNDINENDKCNDNNNDD